MGTIYAPQRGRHAAGDEIVRSLVTPETGALKRMFQSAKEAENALLRWPTKWFVQFGSLTIEYEKKEKRGWRSVADHGAVILCSVHVTETLASHVSRMLL